MNLLNSTGELFGAIVIDALDLILDNGIMSVLWTGLVALPGAWLVGHIFY